MPHCFNNETEHTQTITLGILFQATGLIRVKGLYFTKLLNFFLNWKTFESIKLTYYYYREKLMIKSLALLKLEFNPHHRVHRIVPVGYLFESVRLYFATDSVNVSSSDCHILIDGNFWKCRGSKMSHFLEMVGMWAKRLVQGGLVWPYFQLWKN